MKKIALITISFLCLISYANATGRISQEKAWEIVKVSIFSNNLENVNVSLVTSVIPAKTIIKTMGDDEESPNADSWLFFVDDIPSANWGHSCRYVYIGCESGETTIHKRNMPPLGLNMKTLIEQELPKSGMLYDNSNMKTSTTRSIIYNSPLKEYSALNNYAVIISGGVDYYYNHVRYWNDCAAIYSTLINVYGYDRNHVFVLMSDGTDPAVDRNLDNGQYDSSPLDLDGDGTNDIQYAATRSNVTNVLTHLANTLTEDNNLFIFTMDHGGLSSRYGAYMELWQGQRFFDYEFADLLSNINARSINICMGQCNSGGFIDNLSNDRYVIATACREDEISQALNLEYDAFVYYWVAAVNGRYPDGTSVNADSNNDGYVSMREAFDFAKNTDPLLETPQLAYTPVDLEKRLCLFTEIPDTIMGDKYIPNNRTYYIPNLSNGLSVFWLISDNYYNLNRLQRDYPTQNECTITCDNNHDMINAVLTGYIKYNGTVIHQLSKNVYAYAEFRGSYISGNLSGNIDYTHYLYVRPGTNTTITSQMLIGATVSYANSGTTPLYFRHDPAAGKLEFTMPNNNGGIPVIINVNDVCGNHYQLYAMPRNSYYFSIAYEGDYINITLENDDEKVLKTTAIEQPWSYEIRSATMGALKASKSSINSRSTTISTAGWPKGVYVIKARIGKEEVTEKIVVK